MPDLTITCRRCKNELTHVCNGNLRDAVIQLLDWRPYDGMPAAMIKDGKKSGYYSDGDEDAPFVSETFLYTLLGKEDARTFMALLNGVLRDAGIDPDSDEIQQELNKLDEERIAKEEREAEAQLAYQIRRKERIKAEQKAKREAAKAKKANK